MKTEVLEMINELKGFYAVEQSIVKKIQLENAIKALEKIVG